MSLASDILHYCFLIISVRQDRYFCRMFSSYTVAAQSLSYTAYEVSLGFSRNWGKIALAINQITLTVARAISMPISCALSPQIALESMQLPIQIIPGGKDKRFTTVWLHLHCSSWFHVIYSQFTGLTICEW